MRAKYVKKLWYQDPNGSTPTAEPLPSQPSSTASSPSPANASTQGGILAVPGRVRAISKSQSIDSLYTQSMSSGASSAVPDRTLSRKSSTISSDSGSTTVSKSTDPSSTGSSPFNLAGSKQQQYQQQQQQQQYQQQQQHQQQQQYQQQHQLQQLQQQHTLSQNHNAHQQNSSQGSFDNFMGLVSNASGNTVNSGNGNSTNASVLGGQTFASTPAAVESSDPFSLMTNAFNKMGMDSAHTPAASTNGRQPLSQVPSHSTGNVFATMTSGVTQAPVASAMGSSDPFSLSIPRSPIQQQQQQPFSGNGAFQGQDSHANGTSLSGTKSFDDYLSTMNFGQQQLQQQSSGVSSLAVSPRATYNSTPSMSPTASFATTSASLSPQLAGTVNPFGIQQPPLQRAYTADYPQSSAGSGQQSNPFAMFANQQQPQQQPTSYPQPAFADPFNLHTVKARQQPQQDYFSTPGLNSQASLSPNPFMMTAGPTVQSPFEQHHQQQQFQQQQQQQYRPQPPAFTRSASETAHTFQHSSYLNNSNFSSMATPSSSIYESAFSMPGAPSKSMTLPTQASVPEPQSSNASMNDMFGQWMKPSPAVASSKYPSIDDLDPFSTSSSVTPAAASSTPMAYSNPFSLNM
ncbi:hypothetical protein BG011_001347 [Mortierella polycephala]|uniref:Uncharacterized protein n=1 Tax=Mortierella polycephala TaxID=41804 RepID=A0A9P6TUU3_9FUNG|nr:hypothetical protein BG011_001347 [Mortierella polycephala]